MACCLNGMRTSIAATFACVDKTVEAAQYSAIAGAAGLAAVAQTALNQEQFERVMMTQIFPCTMKTLAVLGQMRAVTQGVARSAMPAPAPVMFAAPAHQVMQ